MPAGARAARLAPLTGDPMSPSTLAESRAIWERSILPVLCDYIRIPNVSSAYDETWRESGHMFRAAELLRDWCVSRPIEGMTVDLLFQESLSPLLLIDVAAHRTDRDDTVLLYGHLDKQPEMTGWREPFGPWNPVIEDGRLYGRGGADDGYAVFASLTALELAQREGRAHARCVVLIEASEESGSIDLPAWLDRIGDRLGRPSLVICLDSGCLDYERMWVTTSLRGLVDGVLSVHVLDEGVHSGEASGVVPSSFRIARALLDRVEDSATGRVILPELHVDIPAHRLEQAARTAAEFPVPLHTHYPLSGSTRPMSEDPADQLLARTWHPTLSVTGADGLPLASRAGNVLRPFTSLRLSFRLPPTCDSRRALAAITTALESDPPHGAVVRFEDGHAADGWNAPAEAEWLSEALEAASRATFGTPVRYFGEGGSIPFMGMLGERFPDAQFVITGLLGPGSNAHGPNEFMHIDAAMNLTAAISHVLGAHADRDR